MGEKNALKYFSFLLTFFVFILVSNWFPLLPGISSIGLVGEEKHTEEPSVEYSTTTSSNNVLDTEEGVVLSETATVKDVYKRQAQGCIMYY